MKFRSNRLVGVAVAAVLAISFSDPGNAAVQPESPDPAFDNAVRAEIPLAAREKNVDAIVKLQCAVTEHSAWGHCSLVSEDPPGLGFGDAALALVKNFPTESANFTPTPSAVATVRYDRYTITTEAQGVTHVIRPPVFKERPTYLQMASQFFSLSSRGQEFSATIDCIVTVVGKLDPCRVTKEAPIGLGVGKRALATVRTFKMRPLIFDGNAMGGAAVAFPFHINIADHF